eukprot:TRINITY_DN500_c0_g1_i1.p1 TRINITY_DN500_c0_g1~~TRINITY_DN500_c0_g1_i1.p1  ORF type:complete len:107 (-),score=4.92 TRINITY_DN500_c0_g1_i1:176-496(-)
MAWDLENLEGRGWVSCCCLLDLSRSALRVGDEGVSFWRMLGPTRFEYVGCGTGSGLLLRGLAKDPEKGLVKVPEEWVRRIIRCLIDLGVPFDPFAPLLLWVFAIVF